MKWILKLDRTTLNHILMWETRRDRLELETRKRVMRYEEKLSKAKEGTLLSE